MKATSSDNHELTRREFEIGLGAAAAVAGADACSIEVDDLDVGTSQAALRQDSTTTTSNPLRVPPVGAATAFTLFACWSMEEIGGGPASSAATYNSEFPGPTLRARTGDVARITLRSGLAERTNIHWHGLIVPTEADGLPQNTIGNGESYVYTFPIIQRASMNWYHPNPRGMTGEEVAYGLTGAFIVADAEEGALGLPSGSHEVPLILRDANIDRLNQLRYDPTSNGYLGKVALVNGQRSPHFDVDASVYRFRVLNGANARVFRLAMTGGAAFCLIGNDGGLLDVATMASEILLGPGERIDVLVDFRGKSVGTAIDLRCLETGWTLVQFRVTSGASNGAALPTGTLSSIQPLSSPVRTREFSFDGMSRINGREYDAGRIDFQVPFGVTERWRFTTSGSAPHAVHVHGASFQVLSRTGGRGRIYPAERGWKDTVLLLDREAVDVLIRFTGYRGNYLLGCDNLEHEDAGMMSNFQIV